MDVPITMTIRRGSTTVAAGTALCASMIAAATAVPGASPSRAATLLGQTAHSPAGRSDLAAELAGELDEPRVERREKLPRRKSALAAPESLVARAAGIAHERARELLHEPVAGLDERRGGGEHLRVLLENLQGLGEQPLGRRPAAVVGQERFAARGRDRVDPVRLRLRRVVLPELDPGVRPRRPRGLERKRAPAGVHGKDRAGREIHADADDVPRPDAGGRQGPRDGFGGGLHVIARVLQRPVRRQLRARARQRRVDHAVPVVHDGRAALAPCRRLDDEGPDRRGPEVESERAASRHARYFAAWCRSSESSKSPQRLTRSPSARAIDALRTSARRAVAASGA